MSELVSIIVPVYNVEKYLKRCIDSLLQQTYQTIEIILVDDGSPDRCGEICDAYANNPKIKVIHQENQGLSGARNIGIDYASGQWLTFVDSDDFVHPEYVQYLVSICQKYHVKIAQCAFVEGDGDVFPNVGRDVNERVWKFENLYTSKTRDYRTTACGKLYHMSLFETMHFPVGRINEDEDTVFKVMYLEKQCVISNRPLYYYYQDPNSITRTKRNKINFDFLEIFKERMKFLKENDGGSLLNTTRKELCIRLCMRYSSEKYADTDKLGVAELRNLFMQYYKQIDSFSGVSLPERSALIMFRYAPDLFAFCVNRLGVVQKLRQRRENNR